MKILYQLLGDGIEELWYFPKDLSTIDIQVMYWDWEKQELIDSFEEYMQEKHPEIDCKRVFVEEVYV